jgi:hypothetical protein
VIKGGERKKEVMCRGRRENRSSEEEERGRKDAK